MTKAAKVPRYLIYLLSLLLIYLDGVGERQSDGKWQAFRHSDDENSDTDDNELDVVTEIVRLPVMTLVIELGDTKPSDQNQHGQQRDGHA